jgi:hypothetical protein
MAKFNPPFPVGMAGGLNALEYMQWPKDQRPLVPMMAFIDRQGVIRAQFTGTDPNFFDDDVEKHVRPEIEKLLAEKTPPAAKTKAKTPAKKTTN